MIKKTVILCIFFSIFFCGSETCFSEEDTKILFNSITELEYSDSLNTSIIEELELQIKLYENKAYNDSLIIAYAGREKELYEKLIYINKPKWYEHKYLWFGYGMISIILPTWVLSNVK